MRMMSKKSVGEMTGEMLIGLVMVLSFAAMLHAAPARAAESQEELAKKSLNPVADLISLPLQYNQDYGIGGPTNATKTWLNIQPVVPVGLNTNWNVIIRTIIPLIDAQSPYPGGERHAGFGDINQSFFFSPKEPLSGWIVGVGPVFLYPTGNPDVLSGEKWGIGPTFVLLRQEHGFTTGLLANHISSFAGNKGSPGISATFLQPFFGYTTKTYTTFMVNTESTYDWKNSQWTVPINFMLNQMLKIKNQPISLQLGYRWYAETPTGGPYNGFRFALTFLFPK
jgi:hypothetical protein